jgi:radical SAM superfamily enzyme YgiQ (UPF0313 family)
MRNTPPPAALRFRWEEGSMICYAFAMRVTFYDCGSGSLAVQYLISLTASRGHVPRLYYDCSLSANYLAGDLPLGGLFSLTPAQVCRGILETEPDAVGFSMFSFRYKPNLEIIRLLKRARPDLIVICGGIHVTLVPDTALQNPEIDFVVVGEGEMSFPRLLDHLQDQGVENALAAPVHALPGVWNRSPSGIVDRGFSPLVHNLDEIPFPDKSGHVLSNPALAAVYCTVGSRGCFSHCSYCNSASLNGIYREQGEKYYRVRSVGNLLQELRLAVDRYRPRAISFWDDVFGLNARWFDEFCRRYPEEIGLPFDVQANPHIHAERSLKRLADCGCVTINFGFQSANEEVRRNLLNRTETNEQVAHAIGQAKRFGMAVELDLIMNLPGETREHVREAVRFVADTRPQLVNCGFLQYFPRTSITDYAIREGFLKPESIEGIARGESAANMRLLPKEGPGVGRRVLGYEYRLLPYRLVIASWLPHMFFVPLDWLIRLPVLRLAGSFFAPLFLYGWRIAYGWIDRRRAFFLFYQQILPILHGMKWVLAQKLRKPAIPGSMPDGRG